jgi:chromosome segregation ATPase
MRGRIIEIEGKTEFIRNMDEFADAIDRYIGYEAKVFLRDAIDEYENEIKDLNNQIKFFEEELDDRDSTINSLDNEISEMTSEIEELRGESNV